MNLHLVFGICALACFILDTLGVSARINLLGLGLTFLTLTLLFV